jgi:hypothetical protein
MDDQMIKKLAPRFGPWLPVVLGECSIGTYDPQCPWCGDKIPGFHYADDTGDCPGCGREFVITWLPQRIIGLRSPADLKYLEYRFGADPTDPASVHKALRRCEEGAP